MDILDKILDKIAELDTDKVVFLALVAVGLAIVTRNHQTEQTPEQE
jgi:hypothetical protein